VTEEDWQRSTDPAAMLAFLDDSRTLSERNARLIGVACCRRIWPLLNEESITAVEIAELYADGQATAKELESALSEAWRACQQFEMDQPAMLAAEAVAWVTMEDNPRVSAAARIRMTQVELVLRGVKETARLCRLCTSSADEAAAQAAIVRDIANPFRGARSTNSWECATIISLAQSIYSERKFDLMPALGAALSDAGCTELSVLEHCARPDHVKGCFLVDMLLGKE
jgi:hypothetical protein